MSLPPIHLQLAGPAARPSGHPDYAFVLESLAIGEYPTPEDAAWLRSGPRIDVVLSLQDDVDLARKGLVIADLERAFTRVGMQLQRIPVPDGDAAALRARLDEAVAVLAERIGRGQRVYLHCNAGQNRAPSVAVAYLHVHHGYGLAAARDHVKAARPCVPYMRALEAHYGVD